MRFLILFFNSFLKIQLELKIYDMKKKPSWSTMVFTNEISEFKI